MHPKKFVGLHAHTGFSSYDGLSYPCDHFEWCMENGLDAQAITEHGQMNSYGHAELWTAEWNKNNPDKHFKFLPGVEAYYHPDLREWQRLKARAKEDAAAKKLLAVKARASKDDEIVEEGANEGNQLTIENEDDSKQRVINPLNRRHHLVILAKNSTGLKKIFGAISRSYINNFYRYPRMDPSTFREVSLKGDVIASTACIAGPLAAEIFSTFDVSWDALDQSLVDDHCAMDRAVVAVGNALSPLVESFGESDLFLELQFHKMPQQHLVNRVILEYARRNGLQNQLIVTCDSHYPRPELWRDREIYKKLGYLNSDSYGPESIPKSVDELKCELYPKNADQLWQTYVQTTQGMSFYDDETVCAAIERTYSIAHDLIEDVKPDKTYKLPKKKLVPVDKTPFKVLCELCRDGMVKRGLASKHEYIERLREELDVINKLHLSEYFVALHRMIELARDVTLLGPARGSGGGSLVNYVLYNTELDPIVWDLPFSRFLSVYRVGCADVDTDVGDRDKVLEQFRREFGDTNVVPISNYNTFKVKSLLKDLSKFYGIPYEEANEATKTVEQNVRAATTKHGDDKNLFVLTYEDSLKYDEPFRNFIERHPEVGESMTVLFKQNKSLGRHAGGVLISDDLMETMPLITSGGEVQSPFVEGVNFKHLEKLGGWIKYDVLGLSTLRLIERAIELIIAKEGLRELVIDSTIHRVVGDTWVLMGDSSWRRARDVTAGDVVARPLVFSNDDKRTVKVTATSEVAATNDDVSIKFADVKQWFEINMGLKNIDLNDQRVYENVYHEGRWIDVFQCVTGDTKVRTSTGDMCIRDVNVGDAVIAYDESCGQFVESVIDKVFDQGMNECIELTFDDGTTLRCTSDHRVLTQRGWIKACELSCDDDLITHRV